MTLRCRKCNKLADYIDEPPCSKDCLEFSPMRIATVHLVRQTQNGIEFVCNPGGKMGGNAVFTHVNYGVTCCGCLAAIEEIKKSQIANSSPPPQEIGETDFPFSSWEELGLPSWIENALKEYFPSSSLQEIRDDLKNGKVSLENFPFTDKEIILAAFHIEEN